MKKLLPLLVMASAPVFAEETRELDAHEHGVGTLNIAADGGVIEMELMAPGADIVGFEYEAKTEADLAAIKEASELLEQADQIFVLPAAAGCSLIEAHAALEGEDHDDHDDHKDHDDHAKEDGHDDHGHDKHEDHADHKDHDDHDDHAKEEGHDDHAHDEEAGENHTEFHAEYKFECTSPEKIDTLGFGYFELFKNAKELEVQFVSKKGSNGFEVTGDAPSISLEGLL